MVELGGPWNVDLASEFWIHKGHELSRRGGIILSMPRPTPASVYVEYLEYTGIRPGDKVCVARKTSNNKMYKPREGCLLLEPTEIKDSMFGFVKRVHGKCIEFVEDLPYYPKVGGAITRVIGSDKTVVNEKLSEELAKQNKQTKGGRWI